MKPKNTPDTSKIYLENIIELAPYYIFWKDTHSVYLGCNQRLAELVGKKSPAEIIGKTDFDFEWGEGEAKAYRADDQAVMTGQTSIINMEEILTQPDGSKMVMMVSKVPLRDKDNHCIGVLGVGTDITDRKVMEEELRIAKEIAEGAAEQAKTEFLENMRHDLRTPLAGIVGFANILKEEIKDEKLLEYVDNLLASTNTLSEFVNEILESIKLSSSDMPLSENRFNLRNKLHHIIVSCEKSIEKKDLRVSLLFDEKFPDYIIGDSSRIHRVIFEIINNAFKFTDTGSIAIEISLLETGESPKLKISVKDTGIGIPVDKQEEIFERFNRLTPSYMGIYKGVGLGLPMVKQFLNELNGKITLNSEVGEGSTFICEIPIKIASVSSDADSSTRILPANRKYIAGNLGKIRVLLVEDDELSGRVAKIILENFSCQVDMASDGKTAIDMSAQHSYDLILMDIGLPDMTGYEVTQTIRDRELSNSSAHIPIIALSAHVGAENKQKCIEIGMDAVLRKPLLKYVAQDVLHAFVPRFSQQNLVNHTHENVAHQHTNKIVNPEDFELVGEAINFNKMLLVLGNNESLAKEMLSIMVNHLPADIAELKKLHHENNWKMIQDVTHKLRGSASYCGTERLKDACAYLENNIHAGHATLNEKLFAQLLHEIQMVRDEYVKMF